MKLPQTNLDFLRLIERSPKDGSGWASYKPHFFKFVIQIPRELIEYNGDDLSGGQIRLTEKGQTVLKYS